MNSYGHPNGPEVAMLDELHVLWRRTFGGQPARRPGRAPLRRVVLALAGVASVVVVAWGLL